MSAILHYCMDGEEPAFQGMPAALWHMIRSGLDRDGNRYSEKQLRGLWLTYCRKCKEREEIPLSFDEWAVERHVHGTFNVRQRVVNVPQPSPSTSPSTTASPSTTKESVAAEPPTRSRFVPPTLDEVRAYCRERQNNVDPERFIDYYQSNGWKVGRNPMKDWRAAVRQWEKRETEQGGLSVGTAQSADPLRGFRRA